MSLVEQETLFGRGVSGGDLEQWVVDVLKRWSSTYLSEVERQHGLASCTYPRVRGWSLGVSFDTWPEDQVPGVLVICPGLVPPPVKGGDGVYRARWNVQIGCCCSARTQLESHTMAQHFVEAHRWIMLQKQSLEGWALAVDWLDESYDPITYDDSRSLYAGYATFAIEVDDVGTTLAGPTGDPQPDPCDPWPLAPIVETHEEQVVHYPPPQPLPEQEG